ncbi:MAG: phosphatidylserine decarboxylase [Pseudomonadota bacterium]|nr:phosphatidylserine decarboxylase [Pseudomonadota bacterium]MDE3038271.1 phosphatidylserine decarboxylase [Pseudomonadota bacterium]
MNSQDNHLLETIKAGFVPVHPAGWMFIAIFAVVAFLLKMIWSPLGWLGLIATGWCVYFFRDPNRVTPMREGLIVSPADGVVQKITKCVPPNDLDLGVAERTRVSIFLNVFDVHVNRIPAEGSISKLHYHAGKFLNAALNKASEENERQSVKITTPDGMTLGIVQIAGLIARRILCDLKEGQSVKTGERFGIIRFGSRVDVYLPPDATPLVIEGQRAVGGETVIADLKNAEPQRVGMKH